MSIDVKAKQVLSPVNRCLWATFVSTLVIIAIGPFFPRLLPLHWDYYCGPYDTVLAAFAMLLVLKLINGALTYRSKQNTALSSWPVFSLLAAAPLAGCLQGLLGVAQISDYDAYVRLGNHLAAHGFAGIMTLDAWRPPGMAFALALPLKIGLSANHAVLLVNTLSLLTFVFALVKIGDGIEICKTVVGIAAIVSIAIISSFMMVGLSEIPAFAVQFLSIAFIISSHHTTNRLTRWNWFAAGGCTALAALFRPVLVIQLLGLLVAVVLYADANESILKRLIFARISLAALLVGFLIVLAPWTVRNYISLGEFLPISYNGGEVFYSANKGSSFEQQGGYVVSHYSVLREEIPDPLLRNKLSFLRGIAAILQHPWVFIESFPYRAGKMLGGLLVLPSEYLSIPGASRANLPIKMLISASSLFCGWMLLLIIYRRIGDIRKSLCADGRVLWLYWCLASVLFASLLFECTARYSITLVPYILTIVIVSLRSDAVRVTVKEIG